MGLGCRRRVPRRGGGCRGGEIWTMGRGNARGGVCGVLAHWVNHGKAWRYCDGAAAMLRPYSSVLPHCRPLHPTLTPNCTPLYTSHAPQPTPCWPPPPSPSALLFRPPLHDSGYKSTSKNTTDDGNPFSMPSSKSKTYVKKKGPSSLADRLSASRSMAAAASQRSTDRRNPTSGNRRPAGATSGCGGGEGGGAKSRSPSPMDSDAALKAEGLKVRQTKEFVRAAGGG